MVTTGNTIASDTSGTFITTTIQSITDSTIITTQNIMNTTTGIIEERDRTKKTSF